MDYIKDNIYAPITAIGGAIVVIRISGPNAFDSLAGFVKAYSGDDVIVRVPNQTKFVSLYDSEGIIIDQALATYFKSPNSFTGEDIVELSLHGSPYIVDKVCHELSLLPKFRMALPGEFSKRAYLNNKIDLVQAEGINALIRSANKIEHGVASTALTGKTSLIYNGWRQKILDLLILLEANIDFSDEDIPPDLTQKAKEMIILLKSDVAFHLQQSNVREKFEHGLKIVIIGPPNSGKSTLLNLISKKDAAIVSDVKGTTRDVINVNLAINQHTFTLSDTAGIHQTDDIIEKEGIKRSLKAFEESDLRLIVVDIEPLKAMKSDYFNYLLRFLEENRLNDLSRNDIIVINKIDQLLDSQASLVDKIIFEFGQIYPANTIIPLSLLTAEGIDRLISALSSKIDNIIPSIDKLNISLFNHRQKKIAGDIIALLDEIDLDSHFVEIETHKLLLINNLLSELAGKISNEEVLNAIFTSFCIGK